MICKNKKVNYDYNNLEDVKIICKSCKSGFTMGEFEGYENYTPDEFIKEYCCPDCEKKSFKIVVKKLVNKMSD